MLERLWWRAFPDHFWQVVKMETIAQSLEEGSSRIHQLAASYEQLRLRVEQLTGELNALPADATADRVRLEASIAGTTKTMHAADEERRATVATAESARADMRAVEKHLAVARRVNVHLAVFGALMPLFTLGAMNNFPAFRSMGAWSVPVGVCTVLGLGGMLYLVRARFRRVYAAGEMLVALGFAHSATAALLSADAGERAILQGTAAVYLTVRALDNFMTGQKTADEKYSSVVKLAKEAGLPSPAL